MATNEDIPRVSHEGVVAAAARIAGVATRTPLLPLPGFANIWLKAESLQLGGAFKFRGAYNRLARIPAADRPRGVVAFSSGNHAQGIARAAALLGLPATIVMPADAPAVKRNATLSLGAEVVTYERATESREQIAAALATERGAVLVPSFDDPDVVEGQGTAGLEAAFQATALGLPPFERAVTCCGGGGLSAGITLALPDAEIVVVEPVGWDDMGRSLAAGTILPVEPNPPATACDALQTLRVAPLTFDVLHAAGASGVAVSEAEIRAAMRHAFRLGLVVEPGGAVALAAILSGRVPADGRPTLVTLSGGNVDPAACAAVLAEQA
ncbi:threonine ammonia-lyase [Sphingomonas prati]|uniref:Threonine dehydratase n=1 Tax=Sphingomonas prati TaxID=1843237 RepID=A0A7W9BQC7_9SPHN|nr:threonine/serine dehydratase [Sphingomonas prati]MBB5728189.1 threonine dehydratase [Sphingomonas prati]GGE75697.1 serine/threonine dehydratase [Sphingomonas prati]